MQNYIKLSRIYIELHIILKIKITIMFNNLKFKKLRKKKNISVEDLADKIGSTKATIYHYQSGNMQPSEEFIEKLANFLNVSPNELIKDDNSGDFNPYKDTLYKELKSENTKLWILVQKLTGADFGDLAKLTGNLTTAVVPLIPFQYKEVV